MPAREYGFAGWQHLREEVIKRTGNGLEWAGAQAQRAIHNNDIERLTQLLREHPALLAWRDDFGLHQETVQDRERRPVAGPPQAGTPYHG